MQLKALKSRAWQILGTTPLIGVAVLIAAGIGLALAGIVLLGSPGPDDSLRLDSPFDASAVELDQRCNGLYCTQRVSYSSPDDTGAQAEHCALDLNIPRSAFFDVSAHWQANGRQVVLQFGEAADKTQSLTIDFARDCTPN